MHGCSVTADNKVAFNVSLSVGRVRYWHGDLSELSSARIISSNFVARCRDGEGSMIPSE